MRNHFWPAIIALCFFASACDRNPGPAGDPGEAPSIHTSAGLHPEYTPAVDSLLSLIGRSSGQEMLDLYSELHYALYDLGDAETHIGFLRDYIAAAIAEDNFKEEAFARTVLVETMHNFNMDHNTVRAESELALDIMRGNRDVLLYYFFVAGVIVESYLVPGDYDAALYAAEEYYNHARDMDYTPGMAASLHCMGRAYHALDLFDKAEASFRECLELAGKDDSAPGVTCEGYDSLIEMLVTLGRYDEALDACRKYEAYLELSDDPDNTTKGALDMFWFANRVLYANVYRELEDYAMAEKYISLADALPFSGVSMGAYILERGRFELLFAQEKYEKAEESLDRIEELLGEDADTHDRIALLNYRANLYHHWKKYERAADAYSEYIAQNDSLQKKEMASQLNELRTIYEVDKLELQAERDQARIRASRNLVTGLAAAVLLAIVILVIVTLDSRRLWAKNRSLVERIAEQDKLERQNEALREEMARSAAATESAGEEEEGSDLYFRLKELMGDPAVFSDPDISRKTIAERLGTNEKYIHDTIRRYYDLSVSDYITNLRLNYARKLLSQPAGKYTIEAVALDAGFSNRYTFHRLFKERYGITPHEFRSLTEMSQK